MTDLPAPDPVIQVWERLTPFQRELWGLSLINRYDKLKEPPGPIFHYTSPDAFAKIVPSGSIRLSNAAYLNDQGELTYPARVARFVLSEAWEQEKDDSLGPLFRETIDALATHALFKSWFVTSFTTRGNLLSQWRAYCPRGGYAIGLDGSQTAQVIRAAGGYQFGPIVYDLEHQIEIVRKQVTHHIKLWRELRSNHIEVPQEEYDREVARNLGLALSEEFVFFKAKAFEEESEWRLVRYRMSSDKVSFYERNGLLTPYLEISLFADDGRLPIRQVFVSPLGDQELAGHAAQLLLEDHKHPEVFKILQVPEYRLRF